MRILVQFKCFDVHLSRDETDHLFGQLRQLQSEPALVDARGVTLIGFKTLLVRSHDENTCPGRRKG